VERSESPQTINSEIAEESTGEPIEEIIESPNKESTKSTTNSQV
jgi:hypothetical protein